jgi:K+-sensing histidine kinase KdpD
MVNICANLVHAFQRFADPDAIIDFSMAKSNRVLAIKVSDNSKPLDKAEFDGIFELFSTIPAKPSTGNKGSVGLPLSLVREFTLLLGGNLWFEAGERGNTATVEIPISDWQ